MAKTQTACPNCGQPMVADLTQLIDVRMNPELKNQLLSGSLNVASCQVCGFQGQIPTPLVYHDPEKELLLTFNPPDMGKTMEEKESALAPLLQKVIENLAPEERRGYLFQPQSMLTMSNLIKNVLKADGITEEMLASQQEKMELLEMLLTQEEGKLSDLIKDHEDKIDQEFFALFTEIAQRVVASQDEASINKVGIIQEKLLQETKLGREIDQERKEIEAARDSLEQLGEKLTRGNLLDLVVSAPNQQRVKALTSMTRPAMDYNFFQMFTELIENSDGEQRKKLVERRNSILKMTQEIDQAVNQRIDAGRTIIEKLLEEENPARAVQQNLQMIDEYFLQALAVEIEKAEQEGHTERQEKLNGIRQEIEELTTPPELKLLDELLAAAENEETFQEKIAEHDDSLDNDFINYLSAIMNSYQERVSKSQGEEKEILEGNYQLLEKVYNTVLRRSMEKNMQQGKS